MVIRLGYDMEFETTCEVPMVALLNVHPSRVPDLLRSDELRTEPALPTQIYTDSFGNLCTRLLLPAGRTRLLNETTARDTGEQDADASATGQSNVEHLPAEVLQFLLSSRYCEVDLLSDVASELFGWTTPGGPRVQAICSWVNSKVTFGYHFARSTKTALDVFTERTGVCRDFQHLAITFCRCMNIPARYATGYLGDIQVPPSDTPMDFSAWFEAFLDGRWWTFDARHNRPRVGRVLMATGRDASDVALTTAFGNAKLQTFRVIAQEETVTGAAESAS